MKAKASKEQPNNRKCQQSSSQHKTLKRLNKVETFPKFQLLDKRLIMYLNNQMKRTTPATMTSQPSTSNEVFYMDEPMPSTSMFYVGNDNVMEFVDHLIDESCVTHEQPNRIENRDPEIELFYEDKNSGFKFSEIPKYTTKIYSKTEEAKEKVNGTACSSLVVDDETSIVCLDSSTGSVHDESSVFSSEEDSPKKRRKRKCRRIQSKAVPTTKKMIGKLSWDNLLAQHTLCVQKRYLSQISKTPIIIQTKVVPTITTRKVKRVILIDGSNVAFGARKEFNRDSHMDYCVEGLKKCIDHFEKLGLEVKAVVPAYRMRRDKSSNWPLINKLKIQGKIVCSEHHDNRVILNAATKLDAAVVSNDFFRDLINEKYIYHDIIQSRIIRFMWLFDEIFIPEDPYGRNGPKLEEIFHRTEKVVNF